MRPYCMIDLGRLQYCPPNCCGAVMADGFPVAVFDAFDIERRTVAIFLVVGYMGFVFLRGDRRANGIRHAQRDANRPR